MAKETVIQHNTADYNIAVQKIKDAILRSQYNAAKLVNREMLSLYYGIGRYISANSREGFWGTGAIKTISERLRKELPGLKGFSETNLKNMRMFYEEWEPIFNKSAISTIISSVATDEIETTLLVPTKSSVTTDDLESFLSLDFTHHMAILNGEKDATKRLKYIHLSLANRWNTKYLQQQIKENAADKYGAMPSNFGVFCQDKVWRFAVHCIFAESGGCIRCINRINTVKSSTLNNETNESQIIPLHQIMDAAAQGTPPAAAMERDGSHRGIFNFRLHSQIARHHGNVSIRLHSQRDRPHEASPQRNAREATGCRQCPSREETAYSHADRFREFL